jgi:transcriptional regulator with XRE-family HTH domain
MDWIRIGLAFRALRIRRGWRQQDLALRAGVSRSLISAVERGGAGEVTLSTLVRIATALDCRLDVGVRWRGEQLDRLLDSAHAALVEQSVAVLTASGWEVAVEVSFAIGGERGSIDILARHATSGRLLVVEVKSVVPDSQAMLHAPDRKARLAARIAADRGWSARGPVARLLVVGDGSTGRRRIAALAGTYGIALPDRGATVRSWLRTPDRPLAGLLFLPYASRAGTRRSPTGIERVRGLRRTAVPPESSPSARVAGRWDSRPPPATSGEG